MAYELSEVKSNAGSVEAVGRPARTDVMCKLHGCQLAGQTNLGQDRKFDAKLPFNRTSQVTLRHRK